MSEDYDIYLTNEADSIIKACKLMELASKQIERSLKNLYLNSDHMEQCIGDFNRCALSIKTRAENYRKYRIEHRAKIEQTRAESRKAGIGPRKKFPENTHIK